MRLALPLPGGRICTKNSSRAIRGAMQPSGPSGIRAPATRKTVSGHSSIAMASGTSASTAVSRRLLSKAMARIPLPTQADEPGAFALIRAKRSHAPNAEIFRAIAICPEILEAFIPMADAVRKGYGIDPKLREMAIVMTCQTMGTSYEHNPHWIGPSRKAFQRKKCWRFGISKRAIFSQILKGLSFAWHGMLPVRQRRL